MSDESSRRIECEQCGTVLDEEADIARSDREPCPTCGSTKRKKIVELTSTARMASSGRGELTVTEGDDTLAARGQSIDVEPAEEREDAGKVESETVETARQVEIWYEITDDGAYILHAPSAGGDQPLPFYVGPGDDPDSAAWALAMEWLESHRPEQED